MEKYFIKLVFITFCANLVFGFPRRISGKDGNKNELGSDLRNVTVEAIMKKIVSPLDTESQKEAKKLIAEYLVALVSQLNSTASSAKSSKSDKNHFSPSEDDKIKETIYAALNAAKNEEFASFRTRKQIDVATNQKVNPVEVTTAKPAEPKPTNPVQVVTDFPEGFKTSTNSIDKHQSMILTTINDLATSVQKGNVTGAVDNGLKIVSLESVGVVLNNFLNILLCNPLDRVQGTCQSTIHDAMTVLGKVM